MSLYEGAVKKPIMTSLCFLAVAIFGLFSLSKLPVDLYPDIDTNTIMVMTSYQGASASDIENNVTRPLENTLNSVSNLKHITSKSSENISVITLEFEYGYDIDVLTNDVRDKLDMVSSELPDEVNTPIIFKFSTDMIPVCWDHNKYSPHASAHRQWTPFPHREHEPKDLLHYHPISYTKPADFLLPERTTAG